MNIILRVGAVKSSSRVIETHYGSGDETSSYTDADVLDIPLPEHTYQRPHPPPSTHAHCSSGYFGLPYQDHNYGMPPPPSPSRPVSPRPSSPLQVNGVVQMEEEVKTTPFVSVVEEVVEDSITRCICGYLHDDGYMICCDRCSVWQHIDCMGVDRNNIPESYFCELCQPRILDTLKAKMLQKRKREELAARNVLSDSSATDTDPEEAANALASMGKKLPTCKKKSPKHKRSPKVKDKQTPLKLKIGKGIAHKRVKKPGKKEKENIKTAKPRKMFKTGSQKLKSGKSKNRPLLTLEQLSGDPWNSNLSPWVDSYEFAHENQYSPAVREFSSNSHLIGQSVDISSIIPDQLLTQVTCVADIKKNRKGLKATHEIPAGQAIIEYKGRVVLRHDYDKEHAFVNSFKKLQPFVLFYSQLDVDLCVDARVFGNEARFVRRSCSPNADVQHILSQGKVYFVIVSKKDILAGTEITIPFDYNYENCSYCVECACNKSTCVVSKYWKRLKHAHKSLVADTGVKRKRQPSGREGIKVNLDDRLNSSSSQGSPIKASLSPVKALQMKLSTSTSPHPPISSPVKLSNVCTLLAASALLDGQPDLVTSLKLEVPEPLPQVPPPPPPPPKSATSSRRGSRVSEDSSKEEKPVVAPVVQVKEKHKTKEPKPKEKEIKDVSYHHTEVKKERRPSSRRQSQEELEEAADLKSEASTPGILESEEAHSASECPRKLTREERKLDAIMKAFEKMEKREERRKEAMARGDTGPKKCHGDTKIKKKHETDGNSSCGSNVNSRTTSQDGPPDGGDVVKAEPPSEEHQEIIPPELEGDVKSEPTSAISPEGGSKNCVGPTLPSVTSPVVPDNPAPTQVAVREESPQKPVRKSDKRKRRRSRVLSTTVISDTASVSTDEGNSNSSFPVGPLSVPTTPALTPVSTPVPHIDMDSGFKYIKTKKHLFEEWSSKQEDESSKHEEELFVQCLPNPHVNTMDHLQRRHSHSVSCSSKSTESSAGSAKKRWLRQAMHEVPIPMAFNHSLSVSTESGGGSPVYGGASPKPGTCLASPGASSPLDFVTPLKKRRLMRESVSSETSNGPIASASSRVLADGFNSNGITAKTNGVKQFFPAHRHSTDDRLLLHKSYPHQNGFKEVVTLADDRISALTDSFSNGSSSSHHVNELELHCTVPDQRRNLPAVAATDPVPVPVLFPQVSCISEAVPMSRSSQYPLKFRGIFERMEVDSSDESEIKPEASSSRMEENGVCLSKPSLREFEEDSIIDSSASATAVVVVNSSVYTGVNNLIDEGSEAGYVTAKSIMNVDSPATVRVDLNAHEMEPSLDDDSTVVSLDDRLFNRRTRNLRTFEAPSECQVNSSEDVEALPVASGDPRGDICDNACMDSTSTQVVVAGIGEERTTHSRDVEEGEEVVDSSQHVNGGDSEEAAAVFEVQNTDNNLFTQDQPGTSADSKTFTELISSSGQVNSHVMESTPDEPKIVCDSAEENSEGVLDLVNVSRECGSSRGVVQPQEQDYDESSGDGENVHTCDSVGGNPALLQPSTHRSTVEGDFEEEVGDSAVSESHCSENQFFISAGDSNVDSTSSETSRGASQLSIFGSSVNREVREGELTAAADSCCDSNYERLPHTEAVYDSSVTGDDSSLEGLCVSSSNVMDLQNSNSCECYTKELLSADTLPDHAESTDTPDYSSGVSQSTFTAARSSVLVTVAEQPEHNVDLRQSSATLPVCSTAFSANSLNMGSNFSCSFRCFSSQSILSSPMTLSSSSSSSSAVSTADIHNSMFASPTSGQLMVTASQTVTSSPLISATAEATPAIKKKVSLLEYRKRLKDKPALSSASETKTSSLAPASSSSSTSHHLKLSPTLSMFLASSPTASSSVSPSKSPSSSNHNQKKHRMPTLATLPLFKDADAKKGTDESKKKPKPEKQLSLSERLRFEFGLEDCAEDASKNKKDDGKKHRGPASPTSPPPPPPPHPPPLLPPGTTSSPYHHHHLVTRHNVLDGDESEVASFNECADEPVPPPPPPPTAGTSSYSSSSSAAATGFATSSAHPRTGFHGSQGPLVNGGAGSCYNYQQQSGISSTTLSIPPPSHGSGGKDRHVPRFSGNSGAAGSATNHPAVVPYQPHLQQQQPPSASHMSPSPSHSQTWAVDSHSQTWNVNQGTAPSSLAPPSTNVLHIHASSQQYDFSHWQPSQTVNSENVVSEDPPPPPPRPHHPPAQVSSSSSSSTSAQHRHHHHHGSSGKSKSSKAASMSSATSSHYSDNRSRH